MTDFPIWIALALLSPLFWAFVNVLDSHCVDEVFDYPWIGCITSALTTLCIYPLLLSGLAYTGWQSIDANTIWLALCAGVIFMLSQFLYFQALSYSESGIVAAYWNMTPVFLPLTSYFLLGELLTKTKYAGIALLIVASVAFCLLDSNLSSRWRSFGLMFVAAWLHVAYFIIQKWVFDQSPVYQGFLFISLGIIATGLLPLLIPKGRTIFIFNLPKLSPIFKLFFLIEGVNLVALATSQYAVSYGSPSLVSAVESTLPAYCFGLSFTLFAVLRKYGDEEAKKRLLFKLSLVAVMALGVWLVS